MSRSLSEVGAAPPPKPIAAAAGQPELAVSRSRRRLAGGLLRALRPKQWVKNVLVVAAPASAGVLLRPAVLGQTAVALVTFTACAAAGYLINDAGDVASDRRHPTKRFRPIAAGLVPVAVARATALLLTVSALRYGMLLERGQGGAPEDVVLGDRPLLVAGMLWVITFGLGVFVSNM